MEWIVAIIVVGLILCPPKYDPAIMLKIWLDKRKRENDE